MDEMEEKFCPDFDQELCSAFGDEVMSFTCLFWSGERLFDEAMLSLEKDFDNDFVKEPFLHHKRFIDHPAFI